MGLIRRQWEREGQGIGGRRIRARRRSGGLAHRPGAEALEPRCLMAGPSLSVTGTSLTEKFQKSFTATVASFTDSNTSEPASHFRALIEWGDGSSSPGTIKANKKVKGEFTVTGTHVYANGVDDQELNINVTDKATRQSASSMTTVNVKGAPIGVDLDSSDAVEGVPYTSLTAFVTELEGHASAISKLQAVATITYPDGTSETVPFHSDAPGDMAAEPSGVYKFPESTPPAPFPTVSVDISGSFVEGRKTFTFHKVDATQIYVEDAPLTAYTPPGSSSAFTGDSGEPVVSTLYFLDGSTLATAKEYTATVNWGDGTPAVSLTNSNFVVNGQVVNDKAEVVVTCTHAYQGSGPFPITITVNDVGGQSVVLNGTATVNSPVSLQMLGPQYVFAGSAPPLPPDWESQIAYFYGAPGATLSQYQFTIDWGDGQTTTDPYFYDELSDSAQLIDDHSYAVGNDDPPAKYTIKVSVTGPGISSALPPLTITDTIFVYQHGQYS